MCELIAAVTKPSKKWHKKQHQNKHKTQINNTTSNYQKKKKHTKSTQDRDPPPFTTTTQTPQITSRHSSLPPKQTMMRHRESERTHLIGIHRCSPPLYLASLSPQGGLASPQTIDPSTYHRRPRTMPLPDPLSLSLLISFFPLSEPRSEA